MVAHVSTVESTVRSIGAGDRSVRWRTTATEGAMRAPTLGVMLLTGLASAAPAQQNEQTRPPIIDVHLHAYERDERWTLKVPNPRTGQPMTASTEQEHMPATFAEMKRYNIVKAVVSNQYPAVLRWHAAAPDRIVVSYGFDDPARVDLALVRREHAAGRLMALGEVALQYEGVSPNDPKMEPIWALAEGSMFRLASKQGSPPRGHRIRAVPSSVIR